MGELMGFGVVILAIPIAAVIKICTHEMRHLLGIRVVESKSEAL